MNEEKSIYEQLDENDLIDLQQQGRWHSVIFAGKCVLCTIGVLIITASIVFYPKLKKLLYHHDNK